MISRAYGYNSADTWRSHDWRHPLGKLQDYIWWVYERRSENDDDIKQAIEWIKEHITEIKADLNIDDWLENSSVKDFISSLEANNETSEQW